jgi:UDP-2,3-diacylglucosamine pyrophosphatase LpxH
MVELSQDTLIVFVSDSHIGGDPGCDGFESPEELEALFKELAGSKGPIELVLAGDLFDFLQISTTDSGLDRAAATVSRPEYVGMFEALRRFNEQEQKRVIYLPGNHDAEMWWNPEIQKTLRERGLVDEFALSYLASIEAGGERRTIDCEHGNQFDPANTIEDYGDPLDTPLGHHVVTDFTRRVAPFGEVARGLDLSEVKNVYPLVEIPRWIASRYFYDAVGLVTAYLLLPLLVAYAVYRGVAYTLAIANEIPSNSPTIFLGSYQELPWVHRFFLDIGVFGLLILLIFAIFFLVIRRVVRGTIASVNLKERALLSRRDFSEQDPRHHAGRRPNADEHFRARRRDRRTGLWTHAPAVTPGGKEARWLACGNGQLRVLVTPASAHLATPQGSANLRVEVRAHPCAGLRAGLLVARGALGAAQTRRAAADEDRAPPLAVPQAFTTPCELQATPAGGVYPVAVCGREG